MLHCHRFNFHILMFYFGIGSILVSRLRVCKFAYMLKCICSPKINTSSAFVVFHGCLQGGKNFESPGTHSQLQLNRRCSAFLFQLAYCKQVSFFQCVQWPDFCAFSW